MDFPNPIKDLIIKDPTALKSTAVGRLTHKILSSLPNKYVTKRYQTKQDQGKGKNVRIVFSGLHDNDDVRYAEETLRKKYANSTLFVFGHNQLEDALQFAKTIEPNKQVSVYGYSWGGDDARKFIEVKDLPI